MRLSSAVIAFIICSSAFADPPHVATTELKPPQQVRASFKVPDGFEIQLVAAEPDIAKPINMAFDAKGRLWVTCTVEYPYPAKVGQGRDFVAVLSDFGPDGRARNVNRFCEGLNIPIGILPYKDGAIVYSIPNLWMLRDTDGDGKCDKREVLYSGFGHKDTHGMVNGLFMGFDGWVYACHGYANDSKIKGKDGHEISMNSGNVFRFKPDGSRVELFARGQVNPFGSCMDKWGNLYTACCHSKPINLVLRGGVYESFSKPHDGLGFAPAMVHQYRGSTALCGLSWYDADYFPKQYQESFYLGDVVNNCINRFTVTWQGATPTANQQADFMTSTDPWFRPCDIKLGPDGALYVADFYNRIIGHYEVPLNHPGRDRTSGRIWRIVRKDKKPDAVPDRTKASVEELIKDLGSANITVRFAAMNELVARGKPSVDNTISSVESESRASVKALLLWTLVQSANNDAVEGVVNLMRRKMGAFADKDGLFAVHFIRLMTELGQFTDGYEDNMLAASDRRVLGDFVELLRFLTLANVMLPDRSLPKLLSLSPIASNDPVLKCRLRIALRDILAKHKTPGELNRSPDDYQIIAEVALGIPSERGAELILRFVNESTGSPDISPAMIRHAIQYGRLQADQIERFLAKLEARHAFQPVKQCILIAAIVEGYRITGEPLPSRVRDWAARAVTAAMSEKKAAINADVIELAGVAGTPPLIKAVCEIATDKNYAPRLRSVAMDVVTRHSVVVTSRLMGDPDEAIEIRENAARALVSVNTDDARKALAEAMPIVPARVAVVIAQGFAQSKPGAEQLCDAVAQGKASPRLLLDRGVKPKLDAAGLQERVAKLTEGLPPMDKQIEELIAKRREGFVRAKPQATIGKPLFTKHCAVCHQIGGEGAKIGPQLDGIGVRGLDRLLEDVLDPNRNVDPNFRATQLQLNDGRSLSGLLLREEGQVLFLSDAQGKEFTVRANNIESRSISPLSAMAANVADSMSEAEFYALMAYLLTLKK